MATRGGQELPSIAFSIPGAMDYVAADLTMDVPCTCSAACPSLSPSLSTMDVPCTCSAAACPSLPA